MLSLAVLPLLVSVMLLAAPPRPEAQAQPAQTQVSPQPIQYVPQPVFCVKGTNALCSVLPAYIGPDPRLKNVAGYDGLYGPPPTPASGDVQTPFDNMAWQMFVALNWAANAPNQPAAAGLTSRACGSGKPIPRSAVCSAIRR